MRGARFGAQLFRAAFAQDQVWLKDRRYSEGIGRSRGRSRNSPRYRAASSVTTRTTFCTRRRVHEADRRAEVPASPRRSAYRPSASSGAKPTAARPNPPRWLSAPAWPRPTTNSSRPRAKTPTTLSKQRNVSGLGDLQLTILPQRPCRRRHLRRLPAVDAALRTIRNSTYNRITARFGGGLIWTPGGGMFDWRVGYEFGLTYFEDEHFRG